MTCAPAWPRLLDDNRELYVPELGEAVKPHPRFMLFATQNPAGAAYGGRKALSRAFRCVLACAACLGSVGKCFTMRTCTLSTL